MSLDRECLQYVKAAKDRLSIADPPRHEHLDVFHAGSLIFVLGLGEQRNIANGIHCGVTRL